MALTDGQVDAGRVEICRAAMRVFARGGIEAVTLRAIATELGWSSTRPYRYFASKDEIIVALRAATFARFADVLEAAIAGETDPAAGLAALVRAYTEAALADPDSYRLLLDMRQAHARVGKATVYRTLKLLVDCGIVKEVQRSFDKHSCFNFLNLI